MWDIKSDGQFATAVQVGKGNVMKGYRLVYLCVAASLPSLVHADAPDSEWLGKLQSALDFCSQHYPTSALRYREQAKQLLQNATMQEVAEARRMGGYKDAYEANRAALGQLNRDERSAACNSNWQAGTDDPSDVRTEEKSSSAEGGST